MKNGLIGLAVLILLILVGLFYKEGNNDGQVNWETYDDVIDKVLIEKASGTIKLFKQGDDWKVTDKAYRAELSFINLALAPLTNARNFELISTFTNGYSKFGLEPENRVIVTAFEGDKEVKNFTIGDVVSSYSHTYVIIDDTGYVYQASGNFRSDFDKKISDFREKDMIVFQKDQLVSLEIIDKKQGTKTIKKVKVASKEDSKDTNAVSKPAEEYWGDEKGNKLNQELVNDVVNILSHLNALAFLDKTYESYNQNKFVRKFIITTRSGKDFLMIADGQDGVECIVEGFKTGFTISEENQESLLTTYKDIRE